MPSTTADKFMTAAGLDPADLSVVLPTVDPAAVAVRIAPAWFRAMWVRGISAVAMPWAIYLEPATYARCRDAADASTGALIVHELTHLEQWRRGGLRHLVQYVGDYLGGRRRGLAHWEAYRQVRFEAEARDTAATFVSGRSR